MTKDEIWEKAVSVWRTGSMEIEKLIDSTDKDLFISTVKQIAACKGRVVTTGVGTSGAAAKKIAHSLSCIERPSFFLDPGDGVHGALGSVQEGDVAILISKGGGTVEILNLIPALQSKNVTIIGVTEMSDSPLAKNSDILLKVKVEKEADSMNMLATTSTMAVIVLFDAICIALMEETGYTREQFAVIHPGGAVGKRLMEGLE